MKKANMLTEVALLATIYAIILGVSLYVPVLSAVFIWALPLPFVVAAVRRGWQAAVGLLVIAFVLTALIGTIGSLPITFVFGSSGVLVGLLYAKKKPAFDILMGGSLVYIFHLVLLYVGSIVIFDIDPMKEAVELTRQSLETAEKIAGVFGPINESQMVLFNEWLAMLEFLAPTMLIVVGILFALVTQLLTNFMLKRLNYDVAPFKPFREWSFPKSFLWYYLIVVILSFFELEKGTIVYIAVLNLMLLLEYMMIVQGLTVIFYFAHAKKWSKSLPIVITIIAFLFALPLQLIKLLGIVDLGFELRKRIKS